MVRGYIVLQAGFIHGEIKLFLSILTLAGNEFHRVGAATKRDPFPGYIFTQGM